MKLGSGLMVAACVLAAGTGTVRAQAKTDQDLLQGSWVIVGKEFMGKKATKKEVLLLKGEMVVKGNTVTQWAEEEGKKEIVSKSKFKLNPKAKPKAVDVTYTAGALKGKTVRAIYELKGDTLKVCFAIGSKRRPKKFAGEEDGRTLFLTYKRVKK
jgi:uncharacterized protein (TIGR03067 family)